MTKIALILSSGASLGTYVGGALTEILLALERNGSAEPVTVDVITGSSAGALNAALAARSLVVNPSLRPWIERAWVEAADTRHLFDPARRRRTGILDADAVDELTRPLLCAEPASDDRTSPHAGAPLRVGITLTNLDGIPYAFRHGFLNAPDRFFGTRVHRDWIEFELGDESPAGHPVWEKVRLSAVASASFPFVFPPRKLIRELTEFPGANLESDGDGRAAMWYTDGGILDSEPVGLAKRLVERSPGHQGEDWRYVLVDPHLEREGAGAAATPRAPEGVAEVAERLTRAVLGQGAARDWIRTHKTNVRLEILEELVSRLPDLHSRLDDPEAVGLGRHIGELAESVAEMKVRMRRGEAGGSADPALDYLNENQRRIESDPRYAPALDDVASRAGRSRVTKLIFVLEAAAGLRDKDWMPLYLVAPPRDEELAGAFLGHFGGFFDRRHREHDFRAGRRDARRLLEGDLSDVFDYEPDEEKAYSAEGEKGSFADLPPAAHRTVREMVEGEVGRLLERVRPGGLARLFSWAWRPALRRWATDRVVEGLRKAG